MPKLPRVPASLVVKILYRAGFYRYHQSGSHIQLRHITRLELRVTIPFHNKDLNPKTLKTILKQAGISVDKFIDLM
jgi:predicted RNA binding protein YcfA (HicA-like mRNA interferase family)